MNVIQTNFNYTKPLIDLNLDKVLFIPLHHTGCKTYTPEQCHADHLKNGWSGAGYNEFIRKDGTVYIMRGDHIGAQCKNNNSKTYGICCEGDYNVETEMPQVQFEALIERIQYHKVRFKNLVDVKPHSYFNPTSCPGKYFPLQQIYSALEGKQKMLDLYNSILVLQTSGIINSPDYWKENALIGGLVKGEYVASLIIRMANKLKGSK